MKPQKSEEVTLCKSIVLRPNLNTMIATTTFSDNLISRISAGLGTSIAISIVSI